MALELLSREDIPLVTLIGKAGTGKTLLALAAGLLQTEDLGIYKSWSSQDRLFLLAKTSDTCPAKRGKAKALDAPIFDNLEFLFNAKKPGSLRPFCRVLAQFRLRR